MDLLDFTMHIKAGNWRRYYQRTQSANYQAVKDMVCNSFDQKCAYCGYASDKNNLVNKNFDYHDNSKNNIVPACTLCTPCVVMDGFGQDPAFGGVIVFIPEFTQIQINHLVRALYASSEKNATYHSRLNEIFLSFEERKEYVEKIFGKNSFQIEYFAQGLLDIFIDSKKLQHPIFKNLRFLPDKAKLKNEIPDFVRTYFHTN